MHSIGRVGKTRSSERGAVMVFVAIALPVLALFVSLAIDFAHFFDYSRNLQNRVDAAVLAAGTEYGGACFGTPTQAQLDAIGRRGQQYSGPPVGTPDANLPYTYASAAALPGGYQNQPNLTAGTAANLHLVLNASKSWDKGGVSFEMGNYCAATYSDPAGPAVDGWLTQANLPLFFPLLNVTPTISAHARVELQEAQGESSTSPIAVGDPAQTPCVVARILDQTSGTTTMVTMSKVSGSNPPTFSGTSPPISPTSGANPHQLTVQAFIPDDCSNPSGTGDLYDALAQGGGIDFINTYVPLPATPPATGAHVGSVFLTPGGCSDSGESAAQAATGGSAYFFWFTKANCTVTVNAYVDFPGQAFAGNGVVVNMDGTRHTINGSNSPGNGTVDGSGHQLWTTSFSIAPQSGRHTFVISYFDGSNGCKNANNACAFNGGAPLQETFAAWDDPSASTTPTDSGPVGLLQVGSSVNGVPTATSGVNSLAQGTSTNLVISFQLRGLAYAQPGDPPLVLRNSVQNSKKTGFIICGNSASPSAAVIRSELANGCEHSLTIYTGPSCPPTTDSTAQRAGPWSCLGTASGNKTGPMRQGMDTRIGTSCNYWATYPAQSISVDDPRVMTLIVTAPGDLQGGSGNGVLRVLAFASFYVTGFDGIKNPSNSCASPTDKNEPNPYGSSGGGSNFDIWGHFIRFVTPTGTGNGQSCNPNIFNDCVAALTR